MKRLATVFYLFLSLLCCGCGSENGGAAFQNYQAPQTASPLLRDLASPTSARIGPAGGTLESALSDGTRFLFTVPPGALRADTDLQMTPVEVTGRLGLPVQLPLAVKITPTGTRFIGGAQLAVTLPTDRDPRPFHGYLMEDPGTPMYLVPAQINGQTLSFTFFHLSVPGISPNPVPNPPYTAGVTSSEQLGAVLTGNSENGESNDALLRSYAEVLVERGTRIAAASSQTDLQEWLEDFTAFRVLLQFASDAGEREIRGLVDPVGASVIRRGIELTELLAVANDDWQELKPINDTYLVYAQRNDLDTAAYQLDGASVKRNLPLEFVVDEVVINPNLLSEDDAAQVKFRIGYRLGSRPVHYDANRLAAQLDLTGGELGDEKLKGVPPSGNVIFNQLSLKPGSRELEGRLTTFFLGFPVGSVTLGSEEHPYVFRIGGKLKVVASTPTVSDTSRSITARVTEGRAPVAGAGVNFSVTSGGGSVPSIATTDAAGQVTVTHSGGSGQQSIQVSVNHANQQAEASLNFGANARSYFEGAWVHRGHDVESPPIHLQFDGRWSETDRAAFARGNYLELGAYLDPDQQEPNPPYPLPVDQRPLVETVFYNLRYEEGTQFLYEFYMLSLPDALFDLLARGEGWQFGSDNRATRRGLTRLSNGRLQVQSTWNQNGTPRTTMTVDFPDRPILARSQNAADSAHVVLTYHRLNDATVSFDLLPDHVYFDRNR